MKELSIEQKAKRYDEAIEKLRSLHDDYDTVSTLIDIKEELEHIFPELKESEDERIRKELIEFVKSRLAGFPKCEEYIAYLEKQGEQKPVIEMKTPEESLGISSEEYNKIVDECIYGEQKSAWSEEDEKELDSIYQIIDFLPTSNSHLTKENKEAMLNWLKSLKDRVQPQTTWKPSDEQMNMLAKVCSTLHLTSDENKIMESIYNALNKLK